MEFEYTLSEKQYTVTIEKTQQHYKIQLEDEQLSVMSNQLSENYISFELDGRTQKALIVQSDGYLLVFINGQQYRILDNYRSNQKSAVRDHLVDETESDICAPMPGKILKILVKEGDEVEVNQNLVIVEAMKMENNINSSMRGCVKSINFKEGDLVDTGQPIIELEQIE